MKNWTVPNGWQVFPLGECLGALDGGTSIISEERPAQEGEPRILKTSAVSSGVYLPSENKALSKNAASILTVSLLAGCILFNRKNTPDLVGSCVYVEENDEKTFLPDLIWQLHVSDPNTFSPKWLSFVLSTRAIQSEIRKRANGTSESMMNITKPSLCSVKIPCPSVAEQNEIARIISNCDHAIDLTERLISEKRLRRKGLMQQLLTGKRRLPGFGGEWREYEISKLFRDVKRPVEWNDKELYDLISVRRRSGGLFHRKSLYGHQILTKNLKTAQTGDFLISKMQVLHGATGLVTPEFDGMKVSGSYISLVPREPVKVSGDFFSYFSQLPSFYHLTFLASFGVHIEKMTFNVKWFMQSKVFIPPTIDEQVAIIELLKSSDRELDLLQSKAEALREQKKGLMQQLLTGKMRVKV